jgi:hypothetical protein
MAGSSCLKGSIADYVLYMTWAGCVWAGKIYDSSHLTTWVVLDGVVQAYSC